jgi:hypothetical protein
MRNHSAGAADGMLSHTDNTHFRQRVLQLSTSLRKSEKGATGADGYINWLNHAALKANGPRIENATITELEVIATIWRAITKFEAVYGKFLPRSNSADGRVRKLGAGASPGAGSNWLAH